MMNRLVPCLAVALGCFTARPAIASEDYSGMISSEMPCVPQCTLCHIDNLGGIGRLIPFGTTMKTVGMLPPIIGNPVTALNMLGTTDTDMDGTTDIDEVHAGTNPSVAGAADICGGPQYGCGANIASPAQQSPNSNIASALAGFTALVLGAFAMRRGARRSR